jgi:hypothetical protein
VEERSESKKTTPPDGHKWAEKNSKRKIGKEGLRPLSRDRALAELG